MKVTAPPATPAVLPDSTLSRSSSCLSLLTTPATDELGFDEFSEKECELAKNSASANSLKIITNTVVPDGKKPSEFEGSKDRYLSDYLLNCVNAEGKPPLLLRLLAALLALLGIHGFGQTNCVSCATAVVDTLTHNTLHRALPDLRGAGIAGNMEKQDPNGISTKDFIDYLRDYKKQGNLYAVLAIHRPAIQRLIPGATDGHACNLIKFEGSNTFYFLDTQKRTYLSCEQSKIAEKIADIRKFLGSVGERGIDVWEGRPLDNSQKAGASSAPA
ncbi:TPA: toxin glutamine deamidase domain-containing protein [Yersinia enterocolitica]|uniref:toxin glutamine deamidase domain-containing protein n=1 Tax=Yersinia enterocolitica TaxID=630 RepID=UPI00155A5E0D|nr:toxin glutamine deamidase domain-containing protein [Yersinia enterocolitica]EKN3561905.1 hypothetical protein [Yersinia enterocolitica]EKN6096747.1 hypothetical protein [Yersinia enterocolitica]MBX9485486.1 hypothetical protein [Yersinia enterocolitica]NQS96107.1 hypothetical protein [Yersinia enterocolitica]NQT45300.1 hypothetical protein [Yersinia enterocolitica]